METLFQLVRESMCQTPMGLMPNNFAQVGEDLGPLEGDLTNRVCELLKKYPTRARPNELSPPTKMWLVSQFASSTSADR